MPKDPWDNEYIYIPQIDWTLVSRALQVGPSQGSDQDIRYYVDCINHVARMLANVPERIDPMVPSLFLRSVTMSMSSSPDSALAQIILAAAYDTAFVFSLGRKVLSSSSVCCLSALTPVTFLLQPNRTPSLAPTSSTCTESASSTWRSS